MTYGPKEYWIECLACAADDGGFTLTTDQLSQLASSTHGKPDGAVRQALSALVNVVSNMRVPQNVADAALQVFVIGPVLERAKAALAGTSGDAPQITMADIRAHVGDGMVSSDDVIAAANALLRKHWAAETSPGDVLAMKEACKRAVTELDCMYVNDERVPYGGIPADPESSVWREAIKAAEAAIDRLDVKSEPKSQEPDAVAVKPLVWRDHRPDSFPEPAWSAETPFGFYHIEEVSASDSPAYVVRLHAHHFIADKDGLADAKAAAQADYEQRIRSALIPTTKPEAQAVGLDAIATLRHIAANDGNADQAVAKRALQLIEDGHALFAGGR